jgi:hypothetical protein
VAFATKHSSSRDTKLNTPENRPVDAGGLRSAEAMQRQWWFEFGDAAKQCSSPLHNSLFRLIHHFVKEKVIYKFRSVEEVRYKCVQEASSIYSISY